VKAFVFDYVEEVSAHWHTGGGLLIVAESIARAKELIEKEQYVKVTDKEWEKVITIDAQSYEEERLITFPDAGCC